MNCIPLILCAEPKLVHVLKLLVWAQNQLHKRAFYPHITDFENATLEDPVLDSRLVCGKSNATEI